MRVGYTNPQNLQFYASLNIANVHNSFKYPQFPQQLNIKEKITDSIKCNPIIRLK